MGKFIGGRSVEPDVQALLAAFSPQPGDVIGYDDMARATGLTPNSVRFRTVAQSWRKRLFRLRGLQTVGERSVGVRFLRPGEAVQHGVTGIDRAGRAVGRVIVRAEVIDRTGLTPLELQQLQLLERNAAAVLQAARDAHKAMLPRPVASNVRLVNNQG